jgi:hypothetical protein
MRKLEKLLRRTDYCLIVLVDGRATAAVLHETWNIENPEYRNDDEKDDEEDDEQDDDLDNGIWPLDSSDEELNLL